MSNHDKRPSRSRNGPIVRSAARPRVASSADARSSDVRNGSDRRTTRTLEGRPSAISAIARSATCSSEALRSGAIVPASRRSGAPDAPAAVARVATSWRASSARSSPSCSEEAPRSGVRSPESAASRSSSSTRSMQHLTFPGSGRPFSIPSGCLCPERSDDATVVAPGSRSGDYEIRRGPSYQSACNDHVPQRRHAVQRH